MPRSIRVPFTIPYGAQIYPRLAVPAELDDPVAINAAIVETAAKARRGDESVIVHVDYIDRGDDLVSVSVGGLIEAVSDGAPTV